MHSYSYDGSRTTLLPARPYGKTWKDKDIIGCLIDMDKQEISYSQNGEWLGIAFATFREQGTPVDIIIYESNRSRLFSWIYYFSK